jgi:hypothetical protein
VIVCDPDAAPGLWPGCRVHGAGDDFESIGRALVQVQNLITKRRQQRAAGQRTFKPFYVILDEAQDILREVDVAPPVFSTLLRRGGKIGMHLVVGVQDRQKATLQIDGQTHLLINFEYTAHVRQLEDGRRVADVESAERTQRLPIPKLPDLESFIAPDAPVPDDLLGELLAGAVPGSVMGGTGSQAAVPVSGGGTGTDGDTGGDSENGTGISDEEIRRRIAAGETRNQVAEALPGRKQQRLERIRRALASGDDPPSAFKFLGE